jgi:hypothetical protein
MERGKGEKILDNGGSIQNLNAKAFNPKSAFTAEYAEERGVKSKGSVSGARQYCSKGELYLNKRCLLCEPLRPLRCNRRSLV